MISKVNELLEGKVVKGITYEIDKKIIGVAAGNLIADAQGIVPLSKQGAFIQVEKIDPVLQDALSAGINEVENKFVVGAPKEENVDSPIEMGDTSVLNNTSVPTVDLPDGVSSFIPVEAEVKPEVIDNLELPSMPDVPTFEPVGNSTDLFADTGKVQDVVNDEEVKGEIKTEETVKDLPEITLPLDIELPQFSDPVSVEEEKVNEDKSELDEEIKNFNWENYFDKPANEENLQDVSVEQPEISKDDNSSVLKTDIVEEVNEDNLLDNIGKNDVVEDVLANAQEIISQSVPNVENDSQVINNNNLSGGLDEFKKEAYEEMSIAMSKILEDYFRKVDNYYNSNKLGM